MKNDIIFTPFDLSDAVKAGRRRFWKQVLPVTKIDYKGMKVDFDPKFHMDLTQAFADKAFDQVPVVFADGNNAHNMDPRNFGGDVLKMEYRGPAKEQGTWALIEADKDAAKAINKNPSLGVSARIRQMVEKADGRKFDRAIEHLCLTMNPRVTGMSPWQAVDLSEEDTDENEVVDLTAFNYTEGSDMARSTSTKAKTSRKGGKIDLSNLSDDEFQNLLDLAEAALVDDEDLDEDDLDDEDETEVEDTSTAPRPRRKRSKTKITVEKDSEDDGDVDDEDDEDEDEAVNLTDADRQTLGHVRKMRLDLAEREWAAERTAFIRDGVPPFLLDLAEPVLSLPDSVTIDLSEGEDPLDATDTIRKMLQGVRGIVDLTGEIGHQIDLSDASEDSESTALLTAWEKQYG